MKFKTLEWKDDSLRILDQTRLPEKEVYLIVTRPEALASYITRLSIRGAPALGVAAAYGIALAAHRMKHQDIEKAKSRIRKDIEMLRKTRPTAVNLFWALSRMKQIVDSYEGKRAGNLYRTLLSEATRIHREDILLCRKIGENGARLVPRTAVIMTHCNAGALATGGWGTALGVVYAAKKMGKKVTVYSGETRPLLQGARLTAWELRKNGIPVILLADSARGTVLKERAVDMIIVGADRITANGDSANKIGTYPLAVLAKRHRVPFFVAAPSTTFDLSMLSGSAIPIEERDAAEVRTCGKRVIAPPVQVFNPAFDVTPHELISGIITEKGVLKKPYLKSIAERIKPPQ
jgi:methylthioribose-1-phosphate isomerase